MLVIVDTALEPEVLVVEGSRPAPIADSQRNVVERHPSIIAGVLCGSMSFG